MVESPIGPRPTANMQLQSRCSALGPEADRTQHARQRLLDALIEPRIIAGTSLVDQSTANPTFRDASAGPIGTLIRRALPLNDLAERPRLTFRRRGGLIKVTREENIRWHRQPTSMP